MRKIAPTILVCLMTLNAYAQNYIGMDKESVLETVKEKRPDFIQCKVINKSYNYLKFQDSLGEQTMLFFINDEEKCTSVKLMSHYVYLGQEIADLNKNYESVGNNQWKYSDGGQDYIVELDKGQWFFSIIIKKMPKSE